MVKQDRDRVGGLLDLHRARSLGHHESTAPKHAHHLRRPNFAGSDRARKCCRARIPRMADLAGTDWTYIGPASYTPKDLLRALHEGRT